MADNQRGQGHQDQNENVSGTNMSKDFMRRDIPEEEFNKLLPNQKEQWEEKFGKYPNTSDTGRGL